MTTRVSSLMLSAAMLWAAVSMIALPTPAAAAGAVDQSENDQVTSVDCGANGAALVRLYRAYFNRVPDDAGLRYWGEVYRRLGLKAVAYAMSKSDEYQQRWAASDDRAFITELLYHNLLGRDPDERGLNFWLASAAATPRDRQALHWVVQPEMAAKHPVAEPDYCHLPGVSSTDIPGGRVTLIDWSTTEVSASGQRCPAMSVNANWFYENGPKAGTPLGLAVVANQIVPGSGDIDAFGIIGERYRPDGPDEPLIDPWARITLRHTMGTKAGRALEHHYGWQPPTAPSSDDDWLWAVGGITLMLDGQVWAGLYELPEDNYTHYTTRHGFAAFRPPSTLAIGASTTMTSVELVTFLAEQGFRDVIKFDGGGSLELNHHGQRVVGGTDRAIPVWLGLGC